MKDWKKILKRARIIALLALLAGTFLLYRWSRSADPRFYRFINTPAGRMLSRVFRWQDKETEVAIADKTEAEMTAEELAAKREIEASMASDEPTHCLWLDNMKYMVGKLISDEGDHVKFEESYGDSGSLEVKVSKARIERIERLAPDVPEITYRDVRFHMDFPDLNFYKHPPYSVVTDENFFRVERSVRILQRLHAEFLTWFEPVVDKTTELENIQLLFFANESEFVEYQKKYAPHMAGCLGFYTVALDRFILFNEKGAEYMKDITASLSETGTTRSSSGSGDRTRAQANVRRRKARRSFEHEAEERTFTTLRHEGAHQLFYTYGVHSRDKVENEWLVEGLATFCENRRIGTPSASRISLLKAKLADDDLIPLDELVNFRHRSGLMGIGDSGYVELAYSQAWVLVAYLMEEERREKFFEYLLFLQDQGNFDEAVGTRDTKRLCRFLETDLDQLETDYTEYVRSL